MQIKIRHNYSQFDLPAFATVDRVTVLDDRKTTLPWLGIIDRRIARMLPGAHQVPLRISAWRTDVLNDWIWVPRGCLAVGCETPEGVLAVVDGSKLLLKRYNSRAPTPS